MIPHPLGQRLNETEIAWQKVEGEDFLFYTVFEGTLVRLRLNDFPEECLCTLIMEDREFDLEDLPKGWTLPKHRGEA